MPRQHKYPSQISALIAQAPYERMRNLEDAEAVSFAQIIREVINAGLPAIERRYARKAQKRSQAS